MFSQYFGNSMCLEHVKKWVGKWFLGKNLHWNSGSHWAANARHLFLLPLGMDSCWLAIYIAAHWAALVMYPYWYIYIYTSLRYIYAYMYIYNYTHTILEMGLETCSSGSVSVCVLLGSDRAGRVLEWEVGRHSLDGWFSTLAALTPEKRCLKKKAVQNSPMEWWKMQTFTQGKVEKQGKL